MYIKILIQAFSTIINFLKFNFIFILIIFSLAIYYLYLQNLFSLMFYFIVFKSLVLSKISFFIQLFFRYNFDIQATFTNFMEVLYHNMFIYFCELNILFNLFSFYKILYLVISAFLHIKLLIYKIYML
jgi:hypothetical protein